MLQVSEGGGQHEHQSLPAPSKLEDLCRIFLCCHKGQDREEIVIQFHCIFMSFHGDAGKKKKNQKTCSYSSLLPVSWETEVEAHGEEQEAHRHFSLQRHCNPAQGDVMQQAQPHNPVMPEELLLSLNSTRAPLYNTYVHTFIPEIICL